MIYCRNMNGIIFVSVAINAPQPSCLQLNLSYTHAIELKAGWAAAIGILSCCQHGEKLPKILKYWDTGWRWIAVLNTRQPPACEHWRIQYEGSYSCSTNDVEPSAVKDDMIHGLSMNRNNSKFLYTRFLKWLVSVLTKKTYGFPRYWLYGARAKIGYWQHLSFWRLPCNDFL